MIDDLIRAHIEAVAEYDRLFNLNDYGLVDDAAVSAAADPIEEATMALCRARPTTTAEREKRRNYLLNILPGECCGMQSFTKRVFEAMLAEGEAS